MKSEIHFFKALSDPTRLKLGRLLLSGEKCVCEIHTYLKKTQPTASAHLKKLEGWDIIKSRREGKYIFYSIKDARIKKILKILDIKNLKPIKAECKDG